MPTTMLLSSVPVTPVAALCSLPPIPTVSRKPYGFRKQIEGDLSVSDPVALIDDVLSSGKTIAEAVRKLRDLGLVSRHLECQDLTVMS